MIGTIQAPQPTCERPEQVAFFDGCSIPNPRKPSHTQESSTNVTLPRGRRLLESRKHPTSLDNSGNRRGNDCTQNQSRFFLLYPQFQLRVRIAILLVSSTYLSPSQSLTCSFPLSRHPSSTKSHSLTSVFSISRDCCSSSSLVRYFNSQGCTVFNPSLLDPSSRQTIFQLLPCWFFFFFSFSSSLVTSIHPMTASSHRNFPAIHGAVSHLEVRTHIVQCDGR